MTERAQGETHGADQEPTEAGDQDPQCAIHNPMAP